MLFPFRCVQRYCRVSVTTHDIVDQLGQSVCWNFDVTCLDTQQHDPSSWYSWMESLYTVKRQCCPGRCIESAVRFCPRVAGCVTDDAAQHAYIPSPPCPRFASFCSLYYPSLFSSFVFLRRSCVRSFCAIMAESGMARQNLVVGVSTALTAISCRLMIHCVL
jgi:hypothetical protein